MQKKIIKIAGNKKFNITDDELKKVQNVEHILNYTFKRKYLIVLALTHRSYINTLKRAKGFYYSNERIEFLGDAVLELLVSDYLYRKFPQLSEGILTSVRSSAVRTTTLADILKGLKLNKHIILGKGEDTTGGRDKDYILANVYESIVGAIYLDGGLTNAKKFVAKTVFPKIRSIIKDKLYIDAKTHLQEKTQRYFKVTPIYEIINEQGQAHEKTFTVQVKINDIILGTGKGHSKRDAEEKAAKKAAKKLNKLIDKSKDVKDKISQVR